MLVIRYAVGLMMTTKIIEYPNDYFITNIVFSLFLLQRGKNQLSFYTYEV
jgi:hypothetical protein